MRCEVVRCVYSDDMNFGELMYHLRDVHALGDRRILEYFVQNIQSLKEELNRYEE